MKIAVFGWYGHDNAGDERIKYCLNKFLIDLGGINTINFYDLHNNAIKGKTTKFDDYDLVIIGGGGIILSQANYHRFIWGINTKIITVGISVETELRGNPKKFAQALIEKSIAVLVRDQSSYEKLYFLDPNNKVMVSADLTFLEPYDIVDNTLSDKIGLNLFPKSKHLKNSIFFSIWFEFLLRQLGKFNLNNCIEVHDFKLMIKELENRHELIPIPLYHAFSGNGDIPDYKKNDVQYLKKYFHNVPQIFNDKDIDKCKIFITMRLHGAIFALQKGIPFISFSAFPKQINFLKDVGLSSNLVDLYQLNNITDIIEFNKKHDEEIKNKMSIYREKSIFKIRQDLREILNSL